MATKSIELLTEEFNKLPSIGRKTAQRLAFAILEMEKEEVERFAKALIEVKEKVKKWSQHLLIMKIKRYKNVKITRLMMLKEGKLYYYGLF